MVFASGSLGLRSLRSLVDLGFPTGLLPVEANAGWDSPVFPGPRALDPEQTLRPWSPIHRTRIEVSPGWVRSLL